VFSRLILLILTSAKGAPNLPCSAEGATDSAPAAASGVVGSVAAGVLVIDTGQEPAARCYHSRMSEIHESGATEARGAALHWQLFALVYDLFPLAAILFFGSAVVYLLHGATPVTPGSWQSRIEFVLLLALCFGYYGLSWRRGGQTLGMRAWRLGLRGEDGSVPGWSRLLLRWLLAWPSLLLFGIGYWIALFDRQRRTWPDRVSATWIERRPKR